MNRIFKYALMFCFVAIALFAINQMSDEVKAADIIWDGGGADNLASTANNWDTNSVPQLNDKIYFGVPSNKNCTWDITTQMTDFFILETYTNNITFSSSLTLSNNMIFKAGTINVNKDISGNWMQFNDGIVNQNANLTFGGGIVSGTKGTWNYYNGNQITKSWDEVDHQYPTFNLYGNIILTYGLSVNNNLLLNGQWTGNIYYNGTTDISTDQQHWTGWLYTQNDIAIEYNAYAYLEFSHDDWLSIQLESWSGTDNFTWNATSVASQTVQWSWSRGEANAMYDEYMDTIYIGSDETNAGGMGEFTSTFSGSHAFLLSRSSFLPASTDIDDSVWLAILFMSIATLINFVGYARKIGLLQIVSFLVLLVGIFTAVDVWTELWTLPTLFILSNAVIFIMGMMRKG